MLPKSKYFNFQLYAVNARDYIQSRFIKEGTFDCKVSKWIVENVQENWTIYDVGANIFEYTELFARKTGPGGVVYAFEPQADLVKGYNIARRGNNYNNVAPIHIHQVALGSSNEKVTLTKPFLNAGGSSFNSEFNKISKSPQSAKKVSKETIKVVRADSAELNLPPTIPDLIKLDIEGAEEFFWEGAPENIKKSKRILAEITYNITPSWLVEEYLQNRKAYSLNTKKFLYTANEVLFEAKTNPDRQTNIIFSVKE